MGIVNLNRLVPEPIQVQLGDKVYSLPRSLPVKHVLPILRLYEKARKMEEMPDAEQVSFIEEVSDRAAAILTSGERDKDAAKAAALEVLTLQQALQILELVIQGPKPEEITGADEGGAIPQEAKTTK